MSFERGRAVAGSLRTTTRALLSDGDGWILLTVSMGWFLVLGARLVIPALLAPISAEFGLDLAGAGSIYSLLLFVAALLQFPSGILCDRLGGGRVMLAGFLLTFGGVVLMAVAPALVAFVLGVVLFGLGTGTFGTPRVTVLAETYDEHEGTALGVLSGFGNAGTSILPVVAGALAVTVGWRAGFGVLVPLFLLTALGIYVFVPAGEARGEGTAVRDTLRDVLAAARARDVVLITAVMTTMFFNYQGLTGMLVAYLMQAKGLSQTTASTLLGVFFVGGIGFQLVAGNLGDRIGADRALAGVAAASALTIAALTFVSGLPLLTAVVLLMSVQLGVWPLAFSYATSALPADVRAGGLGLLRTVYLVLAAPASALVGAMGDAGMFDTAFLVLAGIAAVATLVCLALPRQS
ncbi:MAG: nitrate/nitrite transporter [Haloarculaceae archaeon]